MAIKEISDYISTSLNQQIEQSLQNYINTINNIAQTENSKNIVLFTDPLVTELAKEIIKDNDEILTTWKICYYCNNKFT